MEVWNSEKNFLTFNSSINRELHFERDQTYNGSYLNNRIIWILLPAQLPIIFLQVLSQQYFEWEENVKRQTQSIQECRKEPCITCYPSLPFIITNSTSPLNSTVYVMHLPHPTQCICSFSHIKWGIFQSIWNHGRDNLKHLSVYPLFQAFSFIPNSLLVLEPW